MTCRDCSRRCLPSRGTLDRGNGFGICIVCQLRQVWSTTQDHEARRVLGLAIPLLDQYERNRLDGRPWAPVLPPEGPAR